MQFYRKDLRGSIAKVLCEIKNISFSFACSRFTYVHTRLLNICLARGCRFNGLPIWRRYPLSSIIIGEGCIFTSDLHYNLIGINRPCILSTHTIKSSITIGKYCGFSGTVIGAAMDIRIGDNVLCGANTLITDFDWHAIHPALRRTSFVDPKPVIIDDNVWLGMNVLVLKGVRIGRNSVIGAGSIVTCDIPSNVIAGGIPCRVIKDMTDQWNLE